MSEQLNKDTYFATPIYWMDKPEWIKPLIKSTNAYIQKAKKNFKADEIIQLKYIK